MNEEIKYWVMVVSVAGWVYHQHGGKPFVERFSIMMISVGLGLSLGQEVVDWSALDYPKVITGLVIGASWFALDVGSSLLKDREGVKKAIFKRMSGGD